MHLIGQSVTVGRMRANGPMRRLGADRGALEVAEAEHLGAGADRAVAQHVVRSDTHAVAEHNAPFEHAADIDEDVGARLDRTAHVDARRIGQPYAAFHQRRRRAPLRDAFDFGQLRGTVDAERLVGVREDHADTGTPAATACAMTSVR